VHGKFDESMSFSGGTLTVCGPIFWKGTDPTDLPATQITLLYVSVVQPAPLANRPYFEYPNAAFVPPPAMGGTNEWMADVAGKWVAGPASAHAHVKAGIDGRGRDWIFETWSESITIFPA
jgi:hypothetical protein